MTKRASIPSDWYDAGCVDCPRLASFLAEVREAKPEYHALPVPPFGDRKAKLLIVGLAPGMHGANATGRAFTGDYAGVLLYETLFKLGMSTAPQSESADDGLKLNGVRITNAVKCLPPQNKPVGAEINTCNRFLAAELSGLPKDGVILALGGIAHRAVIKAYGLRQAGYAFGHAAEHTLDNGIRMVDSYHCSRYNTNTGRLTTEMFVNAMGIAATLAGVGSVA
ncbi:MAG: uracil-DNA glycosylase [Pseudomonadota bacterium]